MALRNPEIKYKKIFINNQFIDSESSETIPVVNPATEEVICHIPSGNKADVDKAVVAARKAFESDSPWRKMDASERGRLLNKFADLIERDQQYIASLDTIDNGKPFNLALFDAMAAAKTLRYYAGWADKVHGDTIPADGGLFSMTRKEPVGVCGQVTPWNFPVVVAVWKFGPALAAGCTIVFKPSEVTPLSAIYLAALSKEAGFPDGVINLVTGYGPTVGQCIAEHPDIDKIAFTGSTAVGHKIMSAAAASNLKRVTFELGGKSPFVICEDCGDLDEAAKTALEACLFNQGQICCAGTRTYVHAKIYDEFVKKVVALMKKRVLGDPFDPKTEQGPQVSKIQFERVMGYIEKGVKEGAKVQTGGKRFGSKGYFIEPTLFTDLTDDMTIAKEEIFGPVMSVFKYTDFDDVIKRANGSSYGLAAGIMSKDINKCLKYAKEMKAGSIWVNVYNAVVIQAPFGGYKKSGQGRELGAEGMDEYLETKTITIKPGL